MYFPLLFIAFIASVLSIPAPLPTQQNTIDLSGPRDYSPPDDDSKGRTINVDVTVDLVGLLSSSADSDGPVAMFSDLSNSRLIACHLLMASAFISALLAALLAVEVYALYLKRRTIVEKGVKDTV